MAAPPSLGLTLGLAIHFQLFCLLVITTLLPHTTGGVCNSTQEECRRRRVEVYVRRHLVHNREGYA